MEPPSNSAFDGYENSKAITLVIVNISSAIYEGFMTMLYRETQQMHRYDLTRYRVYHHDVTRYAITLYSVI